MIPDEVSLDFKGRDGADCSQNAMTASRIPMASVPKQDHGPCGVSMCWVRKMVQEGPSANFFVSYKSTANFC